MSKRTRAQARPRVWTTRIASTVGETCGVQHPGGGYCDEAAIPDAPIAICIRHAADVFRFLRGRIDEGGTVNAILDAMDDTSGGIPRPPKHGTAREVVYYLRVGACIKIGYSSNLGVRLRAYPPGSVLLAVEPGGEALERRRLDQFHAHLRKPNEWFNPAPPLMAYIATLRRQPAA